MFQIIPSHNTIHTIRNAVSNELKDVVTILPGLEDDIIDNLRWGIFSESRYNMTVRNGIDGYEHVADLSCNLFHDAEYFLRAYGELDRPLLTSYVQQEYRNKECHIYYNSETFDVKVVTEPARLSEEINDQDIFYLVCCVPDSEHIFRSIVHGDILHPSNTWLFEYMDIYDEWAWSYMEKYHRKLWQCGGYGHYCQGPYEGRYIAQINMNIGDGGSIYLYVNQDGIYGTVDMH